MQARYYDPLIGRFYSDDPLAFRDIHSFNRYAYANNNPFKYIDPDGKDSYLVSRPLGKSPIGSHNFIVTGAAYVGDPSATVYSWGPLENGKMGSVVDVDKGTAAQTWEDDSKAWSSLDGGSNSDVTFREIDANDVLVDNIAESVQSDKDYTYIPSSRKGTVNSNSAAGAVANTADGGSTDVSHGGWQPGNKQADRVELNKPEVM